MPTATPDYSMQRFTDTRDVPDIVWETLRSHERNSNVILPHLEYCHVAEPAGDSTHLPPQLWIACITFHRNAPPSVDFVLSCTEGPLGPYPVFIVTTVNRSITQDAAERRMQSMAFELQRSVPTSRVFAVFALERVARMFAAIWTRFTAVPLHPTSPEYYAAKITYCTRETFLGLEVEDTGLTMVTELRLGTEADLHQVARLCHGFAAESKPYTLSPEGAQREAALLIGRRQVWVHEIKACAGHSSEIASIVAVTRASATVATITKGDIGLRSLKELDGLRMAENGDAMVQFDMGGDKGREGSRFLEGNRFVLDPMTPGGGAIPRSRHNSLNARPGPSCVPPELSAEVSLSTHDTLLNFGRSHSRNAAELKALLGNSNARLRPNAVMLSSRSNTTAGDRRQGLSLEQAKPRARVEIDIVLESNTLIQGGYMRGFIKIRVRKRAKREAPVFLAEGKLRVVGFESIPHQDETYSFYQCSAPLSAVTDMSQSLYATSLGTDGFAQAVEGVHVLPFAMELPADASFGSAKGVIQLTSGLSVRYVAMVSVKVRDSGTGKRSIAHFYRNCEIWPHLDPSTTLSPAPRALQATYSKSLSFLTSQEDKAKVTAQLHRLNWVAGQRCHVKVLVHNGSRKSVKSCTLTLVRTTTVFRPKPALDAGGLTSDPDACQTSTTHKTVSESVLEMGQRGAKGYASAKGWWTGVKPGQELEFSHFIQLPTDALSISRGRLLEVEYSLRVTISAGPLSPDVFVTLPIRIINFLSIDPPPSAALLSTNGAYFRSVQRQGSSTSTSTSSDRWGTLNSNMTDGVMHFQDGPPPPTSLSDQSLFSEESSTSSSMQSLVPLALQTPGKLCVANPDLSRRELNRALSDASVYSTESAQRVEPSSSTSSSSSDFASAEESERERTVTRKGKQPARAMDLANLPVDSDDPSDVDIVLKSVIGDIRHADQHDPRRQYSNDSTAIEDYVDDYYANTSGDTETGSDSQGTAGVTSFTQRIRQKLAQQKQAASANTSRVGVEDCQDEERTPRVGYSHHRRSDHIQIRPNLRAGGAGQTETTQAQQPSVPPRSSHRPRSIRVAGKRSLRGPRPQASASSSESDTSVTLAYTRGPAPSSRPVRLPRERGAPDSSVTNRIASLEARTRRNGL
ncbi:hypothetical protein EIP91_000559 [Steccherinum ochraceum]|uniref:Arrestin C-terminal-like domain-containing protein n=1 Tax=Steccherinum ochraceum TaxID=92696 RepID=A0A4R0RI25_9APHY|nr:hypothetical protein EIP91_000559 [Steccherinum ochraceum]